MCQTDLKCADIKKKRLVELDIVRGLCVLIMVIEHTYLYLASEPLLQNPLFHITQSGIGSVAVLFMFIMGMNTIFTRSDNPHLIFKRGVKIFIFSYVFNFLRDLVPAFIGCQIGKSILNSHGYSHYYETFLNVDILQFVGLAFIFIGILRSIKISPKIELFIAFIISFTTILIGKVPTRPDISNWIKDLIIGGWKHNYFPFIYWIIFPVCGSFFARRIKNVEDRDQIYRNMIKWSFLISAVLWGLLLYYYPSLDFFGWRDEYNYYRQNILANVFFISQIILLIGLSYFASKNELIPLRVKSFLSFWSENITSLYIVSWMLISWTAWVITGFHIIANPIIAIAASVLFAAVSHYTVKHVPVINRVLKKLF